MSAQADRLRRWWGRETHLETGETSWGIVCQPYLINSDILYHFIVIFDLKLSYRVSQYPFGRMQLVYAGGSKPPVYSSERLWKERSELEKQLQDRAGSDSMTKMKLMVATWERVHPTAQVRCFQSRQMKLYSTCATKYSPCAANSISGRLLHRQFWSRWSFVQDLERTWTNSSCWWVVRLPVAGYHTTVKPIYNLRHRLTYVCI